MENKNGIRSILSDDIDYHLVMELSGDYDYEITKLIIPVSKEFTYLLGHFYNISMFCI